MLNRYPTLHSCRIINKRDVQYKFALFAEAHYAVHRSSPLTRRLTLRIPTPFQSSTVPPRYCGNLIAKYSRARANFKREIANLARIVGGQANRDGRRSFSEFAIPLTALAGTIRLRRADIKSKFIHPNAVM